MFCVTTDGTASMPGKKKGFVKPLEDPLGQKLLGELMCKNIFFELKLCKTFQVSTKRDWVCMETFCYLTMFVGLFVVKLFWNELNLKLQGQGQRVPNFFRTGKSLFWNLTLSPVTSALKHSNTSQM